MTRAEIERKVKLTAFKTDNLSLGILANLSMDHKQSNSFSRSRLKSLFKKNRLHTLPIQKQFWFGKVIKTIGFFLSCSSTEFFLRRHGPHLNPPDRGVQIP